MKKSFLAIAIVLTALFLTSCGTTQEVSSQPEPIENSVTEETVAETDEPKTEAEAASAESEETADNENSQSDKALEESEVQTVETNSETNIEETLEPEEEISEKVSDEDSYLSKEMEEAPTSDEKNKVSEYFIFDEPEVIVHDLPEEETKEVAEGKKSAEPASPATENLTEQTEPQIAQENEPSTPKPAPQVSEESTKKEAEKPSEEAKEPQAPKAEENTLASQDEEAQKEPEAAQIKPSRSVKVKINQYLDVTYPGTGWVYIGESEKNALFNYFGRKLGTGNTTFALRAKKAGNTMLHFYKNDALTGEYIDDYLEVTVESKKGTGRVKAPSYADIVPAKPQRRIDRANEGLVTETQGQEEAKKEAVKQKEEKTASTKASSTAKSKSPSKASKNQKTEASGQGENSQTASQKDSKTASTAPLSPQESDIKTVIQTTEAKNSGKNSEEASKEAVTKTEKANERAQNLSQAQNVSVTPISSESEVTVDESNPILREQTSARNEGRADESLLEKAKKEFEEKKYADALRDAQEYYNNASTRLDEALYLLGQISESNSQVRDIRFSVDSYDMLVKRYPASKLWKDAKNRSIYLKRFYIDIR